jgi:hypothetical protein
VFIQAGLVVILLCWLRGVIIPKDSTGMNQRSRSLLAASVRSPGGRRCGLKRVHLAPPAFEEVQFNSIRSQAGCFLVSCGGLAVVIQAAQEISPRA